MTNPGPDGRFDFGRVIERTFKAVGQNLLTFLLLSAALTGVPAAIAGWLAASKFQAFGGLASAPNPAAFGAAMAGALGLVGVAGVVSVVATAVLQASIVYGTVAFLNDRRAEFGECVAVGLRYCLWLILLAIVVGFCEVVGLVFFIVPGVMLMLAWIVAVPVLVVEHKGVFGAMGRSAELTRGHRWAILGLVLIYAVAAGLIQQALSSTVVAVTANPLSPAFFGGQIVITTLARIGFGVVSAAGVASIYYELRSAKEGVAPEALAAVFD